MYQVITFGSATIDIFAETESEKIFRDCEDGTCENFLGYLMGSKVLIHDLHTDIGGGGTNTAVCLAKLGIKTAYGGCVGDDDHGRDVLRYLERLGIDFVGSKSDKRTNMSIVLDSKLLHDRSILVYKGASSHLKSADLDYSKFQTTWFYFSSLLNTSFDTMLDLMRFANENNIAIAFNPSSYQCEQGFNFLKEAIERCQLLVLNKEEAEMSVGEHATTRELCLQLRNRGAEIVLVTDGARGSTLLYSDSFYYVTPKKTDAVENTGAGDCFASTFLAGLVMGRSPSESLVLASINVENLILHVGAKNGLLTHDELMARFTVDEREVRVENL